MTKEFKGNKGVGAKRMGRKYDLDSKTIRRWLDTQDWGKYRKPIIKLSITQKNINDRKELYQRAKKFGFKKIMNDVAFSDECPAKLGSICNRHNQGVRDFKKNQPILYKSKKQPISVHVWGFISGKGSSKLKFIDGSRTINSDVYEEILIFAKKEMKRLNVKYLQEDGAPCHRSKKSCENRTKFKIKVFLENKNGPPGSFFWPGNSPDLNVIENAWSLLKKGIDDLKKPPKTKDVLKSKLKKIWAQNERDGFHAKLIKSFKGRMIELKKKEFQQTKY